MKQIQLEVIAQKINGNIINRHLLINDIIYNDISIDSRTIGVNDIFIPIKGENFDGHDFIDIAYKNGACICFTEDEALIPSNKVGIFVEDTGQALKDFAKHYLSLFNIPVIAVTGSVGKTSCKEMISSVLSAKYLVHKTSGNFNNEIGLPLTIFKLNEEHDLIVLEMGMNHYGELHRLSEIASPDIAVITNIGEAHIEYFGSKDGILKAKSEILDFLKKDGLVILNGDDPYLRKLQNRISFKTLTFGFQKNNDLCVAEHSDLGWDGIQARINGFNKEFNIKVDTLGKHMLYNILPAIIIGNYLDMTISQIERGALKYKPSKMRMNKLILGEGIVVINDAYNASIDSMESALETLSTLSTRGRKIAILGDMFELGEHSETAHRKVGEIASNKEIDILICVGNDAKYIYESANYYGLDKNKTMHFKDKKDLIDNISNIFMKNDTIIIKGSRGMHLEIIIETLQKMFPS
ncbi:MAG: UDP-N-acetylmuramoyl-tripeptide--D-alanyl-D-alanine ligase [Vallitalea sp.]|jgi:UDP-N-acetylmuramoyl-tripeptide--D-alanyl-D-alanine ligase|nr:UDP-N-acetylmuramoyl-tripeptide--D-alanyl-D-alanine ligase [Vallitalea sp.]